MTTRTITLSAEHWQRISDALLDCCDKGPPGEGWKSAELSSAVAALDTALAEPEPHPAHLAGASYMEAYRMGRESALAQPEPVGPTDEEIEAACPFDSFHEPAEHHGWWSAIEWAEQHWSHPTPQPIPVSERLPGAGDADGRDPECVQRWPECEDGAYDPRCCRFPKSCSCGPL